MQYRVVVGAHNIKFYVRRKESFSANFIKGNFWCMLLWLFYFEIIYLPTLRKVIRRWEMNNYTRLDLLE